MEELGRLFKSDPTFDYIFYHLPKSHFMKIVELRRKAMEKNASLTDILT